MIVGTIAVYFLYWRVTPDITADLDTKKVESAIDIPKEEAAKDDNIVVTAEGEEIEGEEIETA